MPANASACVAFPALITFFVSPMRVDMDESVDSYNAALEMCLPKMRNLPL